MPEPTVHDPSVLRAIAHPMRNRILTELTASGSMRAADIARELDIPANQASFHLRQLAKYGLVEEDPGAARDKRDRVWRASNERGLTINLNLMAEAPGGAAAASVFRQYAAGWGHAIVDAAYSDAVVEGVFRTVREDAVRLTRDEAMELAGELDELAERWAARTRGLDPDRSTYVLFAVLEPYPEVPRADPAEAR